MKKISLLFVALTCCIVLAYALTKSNSKKLDTDAVTTITISTSNETPVNPYLFGADAPNWRDSNPWDSSLTNKIARMAPTIMMTPENGIRCNYAHWNNPRGYGFDSTELTELDARRVGGPQLCLHDMTSPLYQNKSYTACFTYLDSVLNVPAIYGANIATGTVDEAVAYVKKYKPSMVLLGVELFLPSAQPMFPSVQDYINKAKPFSAAIKNAAPNIKIAVQVPYYGNTGGPREQQIGQTWCEALKADQSWYDDVAFYNWNQIAGSVNTQQPLDNVFSDAKDAEASFFDEITDKYNYYQQIFPGKKILAQQWGMNDSKRNKEGSVFGNTMICAMHVGRYLQWMAANENNKVAAAIFGGYLSCSYPPTTAIYAEHEPGNQMHIIYHESTVTIAFCMLSDAFHGNSTVENTTVSKSGDMYAQSFQRDGKHYLYVENYSNSSQPVKINVNSSPASGTATIEELHGDHLYSSVGWTGWQKIYTFQPTAPSEVVHDVKTNDVNSITVPGYSLTKIVF